MEVIALKEGFFGGSRKRVGERFDVPQNAKGSWFAPVEEPKAQRQSRNPAADAEAKAEAEAKAKGKNPDDLV